MRTYRYLHYDVFTDHAFEGNQLAVFPEPAGLSTDDMQTITREMNFSECTFIFPPDPPHVASATSQEAGAKTSDVRMRIFTPGEELPMAGHPTIGSTFALAHERIITPGRRTFVFGLGVGPTPVSLEWKGNALDFAWMTQKDPDFGAQIDDRSAFARAIGVAASDLVDRAPVQVVSCGVPFLFAALTSREAVDRVSIERPAYAACCQHAGVDGLPLFVFTVAHEGAGDEAAYSRMLAPGFGIAEDPATGGASGPLGCFLFRHALLPAERLSHIVSLQRVRMRRPSRIHIAIDARGTQITRVRVGGRSVLVGDGSLRFS